MSNMASRSLYIEIASCRSPQWLPTSGPRSPTPQQSYIIAGCSATEHLGKSGLRFGCGPAVVVAGRPQSVRLWSLLRRGKTEPSAQRVLVLASYADPDCAVGYSCFLGQATAKRDVEMLPKGLLAVIFAGARNSGGER